MIDVIFLIDKSPDWEDLTSQLIIPGTRIVGDYKYEGLFFFRMPFVLAFYLPG